MKKIPLSKSYFPQDKTVSVYHVIFPVFEIDQYAKPLELLGSCCAISSGGLYISAAHLFKPFSDLKHERDKLDIFRKKLTYKQDDLRVGICKFLGDKSKTTYKFFPVHNLNLFTEHDIALFWVQEDAMPPQNQPHLAISEHPQLNQQIKIIGYPGSANFFISESETRIKFEAALVDSEGIITNLYPEGRDQGHAWFPCIETSAKMAAGHSGGAALDFQKSALIGINSVSGDDKRSLVSWIGKILDAEIGIADLVMTKNDGTKFPMDTTTLRKLAELGVVSIV